tara:strand:- start:75 stop:1034 length:960 start_codon:yes stop_codon:yes gene_type:complete
MGQEPVLKAAADQQRGAYSDAGARFRAEIAGRDGEFSGFNMREPAPVPDALRTPAARVPAGDYERGLSRAFEMGAEDKDAYGESARTARLQVERGARESMSREDINIRAEAYDPAPAPDEDAEPVPVERVPQERPSWLKDLRGKRGLRPRPVEVAAPAPAEVAAPAPAEVAAPVAAPAAAPAAAQELFPDGSQVPRGLQPDAPDIVLDQKAGPTLEAGPSGAAPDQLLTNIAAKESDRVIAERGSGIGGIASDLEGGVEAATAEAVLDPEIDAIPIIGDVAMLAAGIGGALYTSFANNPKATPEQHIRNVMSSATELGS